MAFQLCAALRALSVSRGAILGPLLFAFFVKFTVARRSAVDFSSFSLVESDSDLSAQVDELCPIDVVLTGCRAMGVKGGFGDVDDLAGVLAVEQEDAARLLAELGLESDFSCQELCQEAITAIPSILREGIPTKRGVGCIDKECTETVDVSEEALMKEDLKPIPEGNDSTVPLFDGPPGGQVPGYPGEGPKQMLRVALNVLFGVFPAPDEADDEEVPEASLLQSDDEKPPKFGSGIRSDRHDKYRRMLVKGSAHTSTALRKLGERKSLVKKWFIMKGASKEEIDKQVKEARQHMTKIVSALGSLYLKKGEGPCRRSGSGGVLAYVQQIGRCAVESFMDCGMKEGDRYVVNICPDFFWKFDDDTMTGTLVHECSHHFGTQDHAYGEKKCMKLDHKQARENADTYQLLIQALAKSSGVVEMDGPSEERVVELREQLNELVGLEQLKKSMGSMLDLVAFGKEREKMGLASFAGQSLHMRFLGNPGTGKTVVARIVGELLMAMGAITPPEDSEEKGFIFREASRADLVAGFKGQTAPKVQKVVKEALGGVLFIDEAYALVQGAKDTFGREAVDTLIKEMEDNREHLIVILAGYNKEMEDFFNSNPGFRSRVPFSFLFDDYTCTELVKIGGLQLKSKGLMLAEEASCDTGTACWWLRRSAQMATQCCDAEKKEDCDTGDQPKENRANGNGRTVRNILESTYRQMALRVLRTYTPQQLTDFARKVPDLPDPNCNPRSPISFGDYSGPDMRCDFMLLDGKDLTNSTMEMMNMNLGPCKKTLKVAQVESLAHSDKWPTFASLIADVTEKRAAGGAALDKACVAVKKLIDTVGGGALLERQSSAESEAQVVERIVVSRHNTSKPAAKPVPGFKYVGEPGMCRDARYKAIPQDPFQRLSLLECGRECKANPNCNGFAHLPNIDKCMLYSKGIPAKAGGRISVRCYVKVGLSAGGGGGGGGGGKPTRPGLGGLPTMSRRRRTGSGSIGDYDDFDAGDAQDLIDGNRVGGKTKRVDELMDKLNGLVGLLKVKAGMTELHAMVEFDLHRKALLPDAKSLMGQSFHMQFLGNPGTGKTVVARIVGELMVEMGVITGIEQDDGKKKVVFEEVSRADLVAEYKGQTAPKVIGAVEAATGGVLFVDEAYSLKKEGKDAFGQEAVDTLIKEIEDKRDQVIAIFAGYENEMEVFFDANPGFKSRVPFKFYFDDYTCNELRSIADVFMADKGFTANSQADMWLNRTVRMTTGCCEDLHCEAAARDNGNGRTVRNILESSYRNFATRVVPSIHGSNLRSVMERAEKFAQDRADKKAEYRRNYGVSWKKRLEKDFGKQAICSAEWKAMCDQAESQLKEITGEDIYITTASMIVDRMLMSCRSDKIAISGIESILRQALQAVDDDKWINIADATADTDCQYLKETLEAMSGLPDVPHHNTLAIMRDSEKLAPVLKKLEELVGLENVKETMGKLFGLVKLSSWREALKLGSLQGQSFHMRFLGNPGTGKTVVARIVGEMLVNMEVVKIPPEVKKNITAQIRKDAKDRGEKPPRPDEIEIPPIFKEASRADLVAQYLGQTAPKVEKMVQSALGGVLFIDEAYAIVRDGKDNFGQEAVDTLIKEMEDKRKNLVVILAGYEEEMDNFFDSNPGFKSRVPLTFRFEDYSCTELGKIGELVLGSRGITAGPDVQKELNAMISFSTGCCEDLASPDCHPSRENGNGRTVRNIVEALSRAMASRVMQAKGGQASFTKEELTTLKPPDVTRCAEEAAEVRLDRPCGSTGLAQGLKTGAMEPGGIRKWYLGLKRLADPVQNLHRLLNDFERMSKTLSAFGSEHLSRLQQGCDTRLNEMALALQGRAEEMCGEDGGQGQLDEAGAKLLQPGSSVNEFTSAMSKIEDMAMEIILLRRMTAGDVPSRLQELVPLASNCADKLENMRNTTVMVPLSQAMNVLANRIE